MNGKLLSFIVLSLMLLSIAPAFASGNTSLTVYVEDGQGHLLATQYIRVCHVGGNCFTNSTNQGIATFYPIHAGNTSWAVSPLHGPGKAGYIDLSRGANILVVVF